MAATDDPSKLITASMVRKMNLEQLFNGDAERALRELGQTLDPRREVAALYDLPEIPTAPDFHEEPTVSFDAPTEEFDPVKRLDALLDAKAPQTSSIDFD